VIEGVTVASTLVAAAETARGLSILEADGRTEELSYRALLAAALHIAAALRARGFSQDDRIALVLPDVGDFIRTFFGISAAGLVPVPLFPPSQAGDIPTFGRQVRQLLSASRAAAVVTTSDIVPLLSHRDASGAGLTGVPLTVDALVAEHALAAPAAVRSDATALIQFTSGSTAAPKGVVLTHDSLFTNVSAITGPHGLSATETDVGVTWLPLYHDMGLIGMLLTSVYARANAVVMSPALFLKRPTVWLDAISRHRGTVSFAPNFAYELCLRRVKTQQIETLDLSSWRIAGCGAEPIRYDTLVAFAERFAAAGFNPSAFTPSYGLAEHSLAVTLSRNSLRIDTVDSERLVRDSCAVPVNGTSTVRSVRVVGCGRPFPDHAVQVVDEVGHPLPERHVGRIVARGPSTMSGYFDDEEATSETLQAGWLHTGDRGYLADSQLFVCGRTKDLIIRHGRKYYPPDLESAIAGVDGVRSSGVVVFGINRVEEPDQVVAVLEARASQATGDMIEHVRRRIRETAGLELDSVVVAPPGTIPRTTSGKVRRSEVRARFEAGTLVPPRRDAPADESVR
jgi:fatty-acyl-CoA synthase